MLTLYLIWNYHLPKHWNDPVFLILIHSSCWQPCRQITLVISYILYYIIMKEMTYKWHTNCILCSLVNSYNETCHVVTTFKNGHQLVQKFIRPSGGANRSTEEEKGKRFLIQPSAQASLQWRECRAHVKKSFHYHSRDHTSSHTRLFS